MTIHICPFCDQPLGPRKASWFDRLPTTRKHSLATLYTRLWPLSIPSPRDANSMGRRLTLRDGRDGDVSVYGEGAKLVERACYQHRYELLTLPLSVQYRWPRRVNFSKFLRRIRAPETYSQLKNLYNEPWTSVNIRKGGGKYKERAIWKLSKRLIQPVSKLRSAG